MAHLVSPMANRLGKTYLWAQALVKNDNSAKLLSSNLNFAMGLEQASF